jgi:hypothetical protein
MNFYRHQDGQKDRNNYPGYYTCKSIKYFISQQTLNREMMVLDKSKPNSAVRMLKCHNTNHFDYHFLKGSTNFLKQKFFKFNIYMSVAKYKKGIPNQTVLAYNRKDNKEFIDMNEDWKLNHWRQMSAYDFYIDVDAPEFEYLDYARDMTIKIFEYFDEHAIPYQLYFSGMGFHIKIPYEFFAWTGWSFNPDAKDNIYKKYKEIAKIFHDKFGELIDLSIYDPRRVIKVPYSLAYYDRDNIFVCSPIGREDIYIFNEHQFHVRCINLGYLYYNGKDKLHKIINSSGNTKHLIDLLNKKCQFKE